MLEVYKVNQLLKHTTQIECISSYDENLLLGTRQGHLLMYNIVKTSQDKPEVQLMHYNKTFSKKPIQQLEVIPEYNILVSLTDNIIQVHEFSAFNFRLLHTLQRTKGANIFTIDSVKEGNVTKYNLCVAVKRKLQLYVWESNQFNKLAEDINLVDNAKAIAWSHDTICVGYRGEYTCYQIDGSSNELFPTSSNRSTDPYIVKASDTIFALVRENQTVLVNDKGAAEKSKLLKWSDVPLALIWDEPYCIALVGDTAEVRAVESETMLQTILDMPKVRFISRAQQGLVFAASISQVWILQANDIALQRKILLENKQFQLALKLTMVCNESEEDKKNTIYQIQTLLAYDLFTKKQFRESMREFLKLKTNPYDVIRLFPDLLPQQSGAPEAEPANDFTDRELEDGIQALIEYLTDVRFEHQYKTQESAKTVANQNEQSTMNKATQQLLQIIDTTLLKCYLQTNDALVAPLLRSNHCHLAETERTLKKYGKHNELIVLYQTKGQHRKALELLQSKNNIERAILYLQHLGSKNIGLILEFADWILNENPKEGIKIFTEDLTEVEALPRPRVLDYLLRSHASLVIPYLEHVVHGWEDNNPIFHNALILKYMEKVLAGEPENLLEFLETSEHFKPESILGHFPSNKLLEERSVILGKLGQHEEALAILVRVLGDVEKAEHYCNKFYDHGSSDSKNVYVTLIKLLLYPDSIEVKLEGVTLSPKTAQADMETALQLLEKYAAQINPLSVLDVLPDNVSVSRICRFLQFSLHESLKERRRVQLLKGLLFAEHLHCQELRYHLESQSVLLTDLNVCPVCKKRFGNQSALVRYPNGDVVHFSCQDRKL